MRTLLIAGTILLTGVMAAFGAEEVKVGGMRVNCHSLYTA